MYNHLFNNIEELKKAKSIAIAVSGGIDSLALVLIIKKWCKENNIKLVSLTVDHLLRKTSTEEANYINSLLSEHGIEHHILTWHGEKPKTNIEKEAREKRYELIFNFCRNQNINVILLGHHIQDQAENFLIRLFRGSGIEGLSSMKMVSYRENFCLIRPFLNLTKNELREYLETNSIKWVEDESNSDEKYLRNKIRNFLDSFEDKKNIIERINLAVNTFQTAENIIEKEIENLENKVYSFNKKFNFYTINISEFLKIDNELQLRILSKISKDIGGNIVNPRLEKLKRLQENINDIKKYTFNGCLFNKTNSDQVVCYKEYNSIKDKRYLLKKGELKKYLEFLKQKNPEKYIELKKFTGYMKDILYTIEVKDFKTIYKP